VKAALEIEEHRFEQARRDFDDLRGLLRKSPRVINQMVFLSIQAYLFIETGDHPAAVRPLEQSLAIAEKHEYNYIFTYDCRSNRRLLEFAAENCIATSYLTRLLPLVKAGWGQDLLKRIQAEEGRYDMECSFLGPFTIRDARRHFIKPEWRTRNSKSLFAYLIWAGEKGCTKDQLINEYWPDQNLKRAGHSLQVEISALRGILGRILNRPAAKELIMYKQDRYWLNPALIVKTDAADLESRLRQAERSTIDQQKKVELLKQAAELCRPGFCADLEEEWCKTQRSHYSGRREKLLEEIKKLS
jgi:hypothetical protein